MAGDGRLPGYADPGYAASLAEWGTPRRLPESGGSLLVRQIPRTGLRDAMGPYPLFSCGDWSRLPRDLEEAGENLVCVSLVADPLGDHDEIRLRGYFDLVLPFKQHYVADLELPAEAILSKHHRYYARKALQKVYVEECEVPSRHLDEWVELYAVLRKRRGLRGIRAFSRQSFARQLKVPGLAMLRAEAGGETVAMHLWYVSGGVAYSHLTAASRRGYELMASYALHRGAIELFSGRARWLELGAEAGAGDGSGGGLGAFKKGWSTGVRTAYLCGKVFDPEGYEELTRRRKGSRVGYFPAYRAGEFA